MRFTSLKSISLIHIPYQTPISLNNKTKIILGIAFMLSSCQPEPIQVQVGNGIKELKQTQANQQKMIHEMDSIFAVCDSMLKILENRP